MFCVLLPSLRCESNGPNCGKTLFRSEEKLPHSIVLSPNTHNSQPKHICLPVCIANPLEKETAWHIGLKATSAKTMRTQQRSSLFSSDLRFVVIFWWGWPIFGKLPYAYFRSEYRKRKISGFIFLVVKLFLRFISSELSLQLSLLPFREYNCS